MLSTFFIKRPIFATVISIVIVLIGLIAFPLLPVEKTPDITPPTVQVTARFPGANADVIAETVATPLEEQINGVDGMLYMSSQSSDDGTMALTVTFEVGVDVDMATVLVQNRVAMAEPLLPEEVRRYGVITQKQSTNITLVVSLESPNGTYDETYMSNYINIYLRDPLSRVPGVGNIEVFGAKNFSMRVWLDPQLLKARGLTATDIIGALRSQNIEVAAGQIAAPPMDSHEPFQYTIKTLGRLETVEQFENIVVHTTPDGRILYLKDVAHIELGSEQYNWFVQFNNKPAVALGVFQLPGANSLQVAENIRAQMADLEKSFPEDLKYNVAFDPTEFISESIREVYITLFTAALLVILTVYLFLEDWRATLIPAVTIPVSLIGTFAMMMLFGISINTLTLFGLVLAIGIVVDDAIVVVENCSRIIDEEKLSARDAAIKGMQQITGPVIATTLVLLAVFVPTALVGGISGKLYSQFAMTIATATVFSTINALTLSPALCGLFLRPSFRHRGLIGLFDRFLKRTTNRYMGIVQHITRHAVMTMILFVIIAATSWFGFKFIPSGFMPNEDEGYFFVNVELPPGAGIERTREVTNRINAMLEETPGVHEYVTIGGYSIFAGAASPNVAFYFVMLKPWNQRQSEELSVNVISQQVGERVGRILDARTLAIVPPPIMVGMVGGIELKVQDRGGLGLNALQEAGDRVVRAGMTMENPMFIFVNSDFRADVPQLYLDIDRVKVKRLGIPLDEVFATLEANLGSAYVNDLNLFGRTYRVMMQAQDRFRADPDDILQLEVRNRDGRMIPFKTFVSVEDTLGPQSVSHYNLYPATTIAGLPIPIYSSGQAMDAMRTILDENLPEQMGYEWSGLSYQEIQAGNKAPIIFALASIFAFLFLAAQYESWFAPISIIMAVPLALFGAVIANMLRLYDNNVYTQIGIVLLIGLSTKMAILLVEFAKVHHDAGHSVIDAAVTAARLRFRPILMTAFTFILGVVPLVIASGAGAMARRSLGTTVFGGMITATVMGVLMIPVFYVVIQKLGDKLRPSERKEQLEGHTTAEEKL